MPLGMHLTQTCEAMEMYKHAQILIFIVCKAEVNERSPRWTMHANVYTIHRDAFIITGMFNQIENCTRIAKI